MHSKFTWPFGTNTGRGGDQGRNPIPNPVGRLNKGPSFVPVVIPIDLTVARLNAASPGSEIGVPGNFLMAYRANPNDRNAVLSVQFDDSGSTPTDLRLNDFLVHPFERLIITNPAQIAGSRIDLWIGQIDNNGFYPWLGKASNNGGLASKFAQSFTIPAPGAGNQIIGTFGILGQKIKILGAMFQLTTAAVPAAVRIFNCSFTGQVGAGLRVVAPNTQPISTTFQYQIGVNVQQADLGTDGLNGDNQNLTIPAVWLDAPVTVITNVIGLAAGDTILAVTVFMETY